jgi:hypothetical protein
LGLSLTINIENVNSIKIAQIIGAIKTAQKIINQKSKNRKFGFFFPKFFEIYLLCKIDLENF